MLTMSTAAASMAPLFSSAKTDPGETGTAAHSYQISRLQVGADHAGGDRRRVGGRRLPGNDDAGAVRLQPQDARFQPAEGRIVEEPADLAFVPGRGVHEGVEVEQERLLEGIRERDVLDELMERCRTHLDRPRFDPRQDPALVVAPMLALNLDPDRDAGSGFDLGREFADVLAGGAVDRNRQPQAQRRCLCEPARRAGRAQQGNEQAEHAWRRALGGRAFTRRLLWLPYRQRSPLPLRWTTTPSECVKLVDAIRLQANDQGWQDTSDPRRRIPALTFRMKR
jgi:hypothetical protein